MTVKLLQNHLGFQSGYLFSSDSKTEEKLVQDLKATFDLEGAVRLIRTEPVVTTTIQAPSISSLPYLGTRVMVQDDNGVQYFWDGSNYVQPGGGGAANFTDLADAPGTLQNQGIVHVNTTGDGLEISELFKINTYGNTYPYLQLVGPDTEGAELDISMVSGSASFNAATAPNNVDMTVTALNGEAATTANFRIRASGTNGYVFFQLLTGTLLWTGLPTSNPNIANALWNDNGFLKISAG